MYKDNTRHPARYSSQFMELFQEILAPYPLILDPMAGTGERLRSIRPDAVLNEIQPKWAEISGAICGDALHLPFSDETFDAIVVSPTYGNRMADSFTDKQPQKHYRRNTYTHAYGEKLHVNNSGAMQWGEKYRAFHTEAWAESMRVLKTGGVFVLNISDHIRAGKRIRVSAWHIQTLRHLGLRLIKTYAIKTPRNRMGENYNARVSCEYVCVFEK